MSRIRADRVTNKEGTGAPLFPNGIRVVGLTSLSNVVANSVSIGGTLTYEDVTNVDSVGLITARTGIKVTAGGIDVTGNSNIAGDFGVGVNNPTKRLTVQAGSNNADIALFTGNDLNRGLLISTVAANSQNDMGVVYHAQGQHSGSYLGEHIFKTNNAERLRISKDGAIGIAGANYGTSGQVLTSQGGSAAPQWAEAGGGAWEMVSSTEFHNVATAQVNMPTYSGFGTSLYSSHKFVIEGFRWSGGGSREPAIRLAVNNSATVDSGSNYVYGMQIERTDGNTALVTSGWGPSGNSSARPMNQQIAAMDYMEFLVPTHNISNATYPSYSWTEGQVKKSPGNGGGYLSTRGGGRQIAATTNHITGFQLFNKDSNLNIDYCRITLYRCKIT